MNRNNLAGDGAAVELPAPLTVRPLEPDYEAPPEPAPEVAAALRRFRGELIDWLGGRNDHAAHIHIKATETDAEIVYLDEAGIGGPWLKVTIEPC